MKLLIDLPTLGEMQSKIQSRLLLNTLFGTNFFSLDVYFIWNLSFISIQYKYWVIWNIWLVCILHNLSFYSLNKIYVSN